MINPIIANIPDDLVGFKLDRFIYDLFNGQRRCETITCPEFVKYYKSCCGDASHDISRNNKCIYVYLWYQSIWIDNRDVFQDTMMEQLYNDCDGHNTFAKYMADMSDQEKYIMIMLEPKLTKYMPGGCIDVMFLSSYQLSEVYNMAIHATESIYWDRFIKYIDDIDRVRRIMADNNHISAMVPAFARYMPDILPDRMMCWMMNYMIRNRKYDRYELFMRMFRQQMITNKEFAMCWIISAASYNGGLNGLINVLYATDNYRLIEYVTNILVQIGKSYDSEINKHYRAIYHILGSITKYMDAPKRKMLALYEQNGSIVDRRLYRHYMDNRDIMATINEHQLSGRYIFEPLRCCHIITPLHIATYLHDDRLITLAQQISDIEQFHKTHQLVGLAAFWFEPYDNPLTELHDNDDHYHICYNSDNMAVKYSKSTNQLIRGRYKSAKYVGEIDTIDIMKSNDVITVL